MTATAIYTMLPGFEQYYLALRQKEKRIYTDEELLYLPAIGKDHPHYAEWQIRKESTERLTQYVEKKGRSLRILEVGCGNGWLSHRLASVQSCHITGTDINLTELRQAQRVFNDIPRLQFIYGGIHATGIEDRGYDLIIFAASIQYFPSVTGIISNALSKLKANGEIHVIDSPFYTTTEIVAAKRNTREYYMGLGFPEMTQYYFHHTLDELRSFDHKVLYRPSFVNHRFLNKKNPFSWFSIKKPV